MTNKQTGEGKIGMKLESSKWNKTWNERERGERERVKGEIKGFFSYKNRDERYLSKERQWKLGKKE